MKILLDKKWKKIQNELSLLRAQKNAVLAICGPRNRPVMSRIIRKVYGSDPRLNVPIVD